MLIFVYYVHNIHGYTFHKGLHNSLFFVGMFIQKLYVKNMFHQKKSPRISHIQNLDYRHDLVLNNYL